MDYFYWNSTSEDSSYNHSSYNHSSYNHSSYNHSSYNHSSYNHSSYNHSSITENTNSNTGDDSSGHHNLPPIYYYYSVAPFGVYDAGGENAYIKLIVTSIIIAIGLPLSLMAIYSLYTQVRNDHVAPIYIINLLISDVVQFCCMIAEVAHSLDRIITYVFGHVFVYCLMASVGFMVCVALERFLLIVFPLWYRFKRTIKTSVLVCVVVWALPLVYLIPFFIVTYAPLPYHPDLDDLPETIAAGFCLLPLPLLIFFLVGTFRALSASISVPSDEKRRIVAMLVSVQLIYMLLFFPSIIWFLVRGERNIKLVNDLLPMFLKLSPLADLVLYVFMRKGTVHKLLASVCCCRVDSNEASSTSGV